MGRARDRLHCVASQPVRSLEIFPTMSLGSRSWRASCLWLRVSGSRIGHLFDLLCRKSLRVFGIVAVFWRNDLETGFDRTA
jgi:hypothetical protein